jgi:hypothetical protein
MLDMHREISRKDLCIPQRATHDRMFGVTETFGGASESTRLWWCRKHSMDFPAQWKFSDRLGVRHGERHVVLHRMDDNASVSRSMRFR